MVFDGLRIPQPVEYSSVWEWRLRSVSLVKDTSTPPILPATQPLNQGGSIKAASTTDEGDSLRSTYSILVQTDIVTSLK